MTRAAYIYDESDTQGPWVLKCEECIIADGPFEVEEWREDSDWRCACCGATKEDSDQ